MVFVPENQVRTRLSAGGRWIRTIGPRHERAGFCCGRRIAEPNGDSQKGLFLIRYRWFESISLHRRVRISRSRTFRTPRRLKRAERSSTKIFDGFRQGLREVGYIEG